VQVEVIAFVTDPRIGKKELTNSFTFTFECPNYKENEMKQIYPESYEDAMRYLEGRRRFMHFESQRKV
jgi:hypothetical protein